MAVLMVLLAVGHATAITPNEPIAVRKFSLVTNTGDNVLQKRFDRRRLTDDDLDHLSLAFKHANNDVSEHFLLWICISVALNCSLVFFVFAFVVVFVVLFFFTAIVDIIY